MIQAKQIGGLYLTYLGVSTSAALSGAGSTVGVYAFRARVPLIMGAISLSLAGAWTADDTHYWNVGVLKNGSGSGSKTLQTVGAGGTGSIAAGGTVQIFAPGFQVCAAGDVWNVTFSPISSPADLPIATISFDLSPA